MKLLFVDDTDICNCSFLSQQYEVQIAKSKKEALKLIEENKFSAIFVNVKFNNNFLEQIKSLDNDAAVYLLNDKRNNIGLAEYAPLIDGYFVSPSQDKIEKTLYKLALRSNFVY